MLSVTERGRVAQCDDRWQERSSEAPWDTVVSTSWRRCSDVGPVCGREGGRGGLWWTAASCLKSLLTAANDRARLISLFNQLVSLAEMLPTDHSGEESADHDILAEYLQHLPAHIKGSELPQKVESTAASLVHNCAVGPSGQLVVSGHGRETYTLQPTSHACPGCTVAE